jgi:hypothetical protein
MQVIETLEVRARGVHLSLARVCELAGVNYSRVWRWKKGESEPLRANFERTVGRLTGQLEQIENDLRERLSKAS